MNDIEVDIDNKHQIENPFPGLRAFGINESHVYFGREGQSDDVLNILSNNRFVTILGSSGTGKSSLMFSGVIPTLHSGYFAQNSSSWEIISTRPGLSPLNNLSKSFTQFFLEHNKEQNPNYIRNYFDAIVRKSAKCLSHFYEITPQLKGKNLLIYLDQFEEIFRFSNAEGRNYKQSNESLAYVEIILDTIRNIDYPIFIALSMRSDFLGDCEQFPELTNRINESHFLIPQMTRDQKRLVVEGPIAVGKGKISNRLVQRLLNDMGDRPDQLPVLQHALMRTWDYWMKAKKSGDPIDFIHYEAIGTVNEALSRHADEAYFELTEEQKLYCERLFKIITEKRGEGEGIRRPTRLDQIATIADVEIAEITKVINKFREKGRALLMPPTEVELNPNSIIDISHEALMRVWYRLKDWVQEESASTEMYLKLSEAAKNYQKGIGALWRPPELQLAIEWRNKSKPTLSWAMQYDPNFEAAISFLNKSEDAYNSELENKDRLQKQRLRRSRVIASVLGSATVASFILLFFAFNQKNIADRQKEIAFASEESAKENARYAQEQSKAAEESAILAKMSNKEAEQQRRFAERRSEEAESERRAAENARREAELNATLASLAKTDAEMQKDSAFSQRVRAEMSEKSANMLRMVSIAKTLAIRAQQLEDGQLKAILAYLAFKLNQENEGYPYDNDIYNGLFKALKGLSPTYFEAFRSDIKDVHSTALAGSEYLFSTGSEGKIYQWELAKTNPTKKMLMQTNSYFEHITTNYTGTIVAAIDAGNGLHVFNRTTNEYKKISIPATFLYSVQVISDNEVIVSADDNTIYKYKNGNLFQFIKTESRIFSLKYVYDQDIIISGSEKGKVQLWDNQTGQLTATLFDNAAFVIHSLALSDTENRIAIGDNVGNLRMLYLDEKLKLQNQFRLVGHDNTVITDLVFHDKLNQLISASTDGTIRMWNLDDPDNFPMVIDEPKNWIESIALDVNNSQLYAGCRDRVFRSFPLSGSMLARDLKPLIERDITPEEWRRYVGADIPFQSILYLEVLAK